MYAVLMCLIVFDVETHSSSAYTSVRKVAYKCKGRSDVGILSPLVQNRVWYRNMEGRYIHTHSGFHVSVAVDVCQGKPLPTQNSTGAQVYKEELFYNLDKKKRTLSPELQSTHGITSVCSSMVFLKNH